MNFANQKTNLFRHVGIVSMAVLLFFAGSTFVYGQVMRGRLLQGMRVAGVDVGGLLLLEANEKLSAAVASYSANGARLVVGPETHTVPFEEFGFSFDIDAALSDAYAHGRASGFALPPFAHVQDFPLVVKTNTDVERTFLASLMDRYSRPAVDAAWIFENDALVLQPAKPGQNILPPSLTLLTNSLSTLDPMVIRLKTHTVQPDMTDAEVLPLQIALQRAVAHPVTVTMFGGSVTLQPSDLRRWLAVHSVAGKPELGLSDGFAETMLAPLSALLFVAPKETFDFATATRGEYALKNSEGRELDEAETTRRIVSVLDDPGDRIVEAAVRTVSAITPRETVTPPRTEGKVIVVDLSRQAVFAFDNEQLAFWTRASTGKGGYKTPTGQWKIYGKTRRQVMSGSGYYLPNVQWVLPYNGDYTLHGTYWHTDFGNPRSHGCTNLSNADAEWLYHWAEIGTPVVVTERL